MEPKEPIVQIVMPLRGAQAHACAVLAMSNATRGGLGYQIGLGDASILTFNFNTLLAGALNRRKEGVTHLAMIHTDVVPACGWLDVMMMEMSRLNAAVVSAVIPIKDKRGLTSTALDTDPWQPRRLTMAEVYTEYPETFTHRDLLLNTGLFVMRLDEPWVDTMENGELVLHFQNDDRIARSVGGDYFAQTRPEDWNFSRTLKKLGQGERIFATRKVPLEHDVPEYTNAHPWGMWSTDQDKTIPVAPVARPAHQQQAADELVAEGQRLGM